MDCRPGCGACCIGLSITSPIPGMPDGKPAGVRCEKLTETLHCAIFGQPERPAACASLRPEPEMCGDNQAHALRWLAWLEHVTRPSAPPRRAAPHPMPNVAKFEE